MQRFLIALLLLWPHVLCGQEQVRDVQLLSFPQGTRYAADLVKDSEAFVWEKVHNGQPITAKADHVYFYRFVLPTADTDSYILQFPFRQAATDSRPYNLQLFLIDGQDARPLPFEEDRFASYVIDRSMYSRTVIVESQSGWFSTAAAIEIKILSQEEFRRSTRMDLVYFGYVAGIVAIMSVYNFGLLLLFRKAYLLYYTIYAVAVLYWFMVSSSMLCFSNIMVLSIHLSAAIIQINTILVSFSVQHAKDDFPRLHRFSQLLIAISVGLLACLLMDYETPVYLFYLNIPFAFLSALSLRYEPLCGEIVWPMPCSSVGPGCQSASFYRLWGSGSSLGRLSSGHLPSPCPLKLRFSALPILLRMLWSLRSNSHRSSARNHAN